MPSQTPLFRTQVNPNVPGVHDIDAQELWSQRSQVCIVDVRRPDEYNAELGHIEGSELIVLDTLPEHIGELPKDKPVVFVCKSGGRSGQAAGFALSEGLKDVYNLKGGMLLWNQLNLPVEGRNGNQG